MTRTELPCGTATAAMHMLQVWRMDRTVPSQPQRCTTRTVAARSVPHAGHLAPCSHGSATAGGGGARVLGAVFAVCRSRGGWSLPSLKSAGGAHATAAGPKTPCTSCSTLSDEKAASCVRFSPMAACESSGEPASITSRPTPSGARGASATVGSAGATRAPCAAGGRVAPSSKKEAAPSGTASSIGTAGVAASAASLSPAELRVFLSLCSILSNEGWLMVCPLLWSHVNAFLTVVVLAARRGMITSHCSGVGASTRGRPIVIVVTKVSPTRAT